MAQYKLLREFTSKHRPTIAETGVRALDVRSDPSRASRDVLVIFLRSRSNSNRTETSFYATGADVLSPDWFGKEKAEEMRGQLRQTNEVQKKAGNLGALFVVLFCLDQGMMNIAPVWFGREVFSLKPGEPWKEWMMSRLNEGIVC